MKAAVFHGYGSSPSRIKWLVKPFKEVCDEVVVPKLPKTLVKAWRATKDLLADVYGGHSMGGALALLHSSDKGRPAVAVSPPTDTELQLRHLKEKFPEVYEDIISEASLDEMIELSPIKRQYSAPILIIHGTEDKVVPLEQTLEFCDKVKTCRLVIIEGMGHKPVTERERELVHKHVVEFLKSLS
ncbi:MAG: prolyl oligopeptidase family serine peptidase [Crenarchaeota archaeon]|nr:prolyl oligopeptidase family serine peptidase [Thermoproteota archaeon]